MFTATVEHGLHSTDLPQLLEYAPDGVLIADRNDRYVYANRTACSLLGYSTEEIVGRNMADLLDAAESARPRAMREDLSHNRADRAEWELRRKDGSWLRAEVTASLTPDGHCLIFARDISHRARAATDTLFRRIESNLGWLQGMLDALPLAVVLFDRDGKTFCNAQAEALLGSRLSADGGYRQYAARVSYLDGRPVPESTLPSARASRGETILGEEYCIHRDDGSQVPVMVSSAPIRDSEGRTAGSICLMQDISDRIHVEQRLRQKQRLLESIFEILPVGVWIADETGRLVATNPAGERVWGGARYVGIEEFGQYKGWRLDTGKPISAEEWAMARAVTKGEVTTGELIRIQSFDGSLKTVIHSAAPLRDDKGAITGAIVVIEDITALHEALERLRASEQLFRTVFDLVPVGLWIADRDGTITHANAAGHQIWKGTALVGPSQYEQYRAWWHETGRPISKDEWALARAVRDGKTSRAELIRIQCFDGSFKTVINWAAPIRSEDGKITGAIAVNEDVDALERTQEQLRVAVRDREEILAIVSHDLRNPLNGIMMVATEVEQRARALAGGEPVAALAESMLDSARRMAGLVDDLLAIAVASSGGTMLRLASVPAATLAMGSADAVRPLLAARSLRLELKLEDKLPPINVDADRILRVLANLLDNAMKFTAEGGRIALAVRSSADGVKYSVENSGPALTREELDAMFQPFWQAKRDDVRGTGLGLSICRSIVEAHGGSIWAEPAEGQRVRVNFLLPRRPASAPEPTPKHFS